MTLAAAVIRAFAGEGNFDELCRTSPHLRSQLVIEVNQAGHLTQCLSQLPKHQLVCFPEINLEEMKFDRNSIDLLIHSDTLDASVNELKEEKSIVRQLIENS